MEYVAEQSRQPAVRMIGQSKWIKISRRARLERRSSSVTSTGAAESSLTVIVRSVSMRSASEAPHLHWQPSQFAPFHRRYADLWFRKQMPDTFSKTKFEQQSRATAMMGSETPFDFFTFKFLSLLACKLFKNQLRKGDGGIGDSTRSPASS